MGNSREVLDSNFADDYDYDESDYDESDFGFGLSPLAVNLMLMMKLLQNRKRIEESNRRIAEHKRRAEFLRKRSFFVRALRSRAHRRSAHHKSGHKSHHPVHWGYQDSEANPSDWHKYFPNGTGLAQSPIDLHIASAKTDKSLKPIEVKYPHGPSAITGGHNIAIHSNAGNTLTGANLEAEYKLVQFHFHWGAKNGHGSEHKIDGKQADAELHFVHMKSHFKEFKEALQDQNGLAVLGVMLKEDNAKAKGVLMPLLKHYDGSGRLKHHKKIEWPKDAAFNIQSLVPDLKNYMTYHGSLTTPPLTECVHWLVATEPTYITSCELAIFRNLQTVYGKQCFIDNFRPCQPLHGRTVLRDF